MGTGGRSGAGVTSSGRAASPRRVSCGAAVVTTGGSARGAVGGEVPPRVTTAPAPTAASEATSTTALPAEPSPDTQAPSG